MCESTTLQLLHRVQAGQASVDVLIERLFDRFCRIASRVLGDFGALRQRGVETGDVAHTFMQEFRRLPGIEGVETPQHLLRRVAKLMRLRLIDMARKHTNLQVHQDLPDFLPADEIGQVDRLERQEASLALHVAIGKLPDKERQVIELTFYCDLTQAEIGELTGVHQTTVGQRLCSAKSKLALQLVSHR